MPAFPVDIAGKMPAFPVDIAGKMPAFPVEVTNKDRNMNKKELYQKTIEFENLISVFVKSDICDILVRKSETSELKISVHYYSESDEQTYPSSELFPPPAPPINVGGFDYNQETSKIEYELNTDDLISCFNNDTFPKTDIIIELPENSKLFINTKHSDVNVLDISAEFQINTTDGDVVVQNAGHGSIESKNGFIKLFNIKDNFDVKTENGNIHVKKGNGGVINIRSIDGDIYVKEMDYQKISSKTTFGNIIAEMSNGNYDFMELISEHGDLKLVASKNNFNSILLDTKNGDTKISLPLDLQVNLDLATENGEVEAMLDNEEAFEIVIDTDKYYVNFGENLPNIQAISINGDILVKDFEAMFHRVIEDFSQDDLIENSENLSDDEIPDDEENQEFENFTEVEDDTKENADYKDINNDFKKKIVQKTKKGISFFKNKMTNSSFEAHNKKSMELTKILEMFENKSISIEEAGKLIIKLFL